MAVLPESGVAGISERHDLGLGRQAGGAPRLADFGVDRGGEDRMNGLPLGKEDPVVDQGGEGQGMEGTVGGNEEALGAGELALGRAEEEIGELLSLEGGRPSVGAAVLQEGAEVADRGAEDLPLDGDLERREPWASPAPAP